MAGGAVALVLVSLIALSGAASREAARRRRDDQAAFIETLSVLARSLDVRDLSTSGHAERVAAYSAGIATELGLSDDDVALVRTGGLLHDLGKLAISDTLLLKSLPLDDDERTMIQVHPVAGATILSSVAGLEAIVPSVLHHHEKIDGSGYPHGLAGDAIPLGARIIAVADAFDAMTTDQPYRRACTPADGLAELIRQTGTHFDADCVAVFRDLIERGDVAPPPSSADVPYSRRIPLESTTR